MESIVVQSYFSHVPGELSKLWNVGSVARIRRYHNLRHITLLSTILGSMQYFGTLPFMLHRLFIRFVQPFAFGGLVLMWSIIAANPLQVALLCLVLGLFLLYFIYKYYFYNETTSTTTKSSSSLSKRLTSITPIVDNVDEISDDNYSDEIHPIMINLDLTEFEEKNDNSNDSSDSNSHDDDDELFMNRQDYSRNGFSGRSSNSNESYVDEFVMKFDLIETDCSDETVAQDKSSSNNSSSSSNNSKKSNNNVIVRDQEINYKSNYNHSYIAVDEVFFDNCDQNNNDYVKKYNNEVSCHYDDDDNDDDDDDDDSEKNNNSNCSSSCFNDSMMDDIYNNNNDDDDDDEQINYNDDDRDPSNGSDDEPLPIELTNIDD
jgi:Ca2+/Na+ antiporter